MARARSNFRFSQCILFITLGMILGVGAIWPGFLTEKGRKCFLKIIQDSTDGNVTIGTLFSISPNYLIKIHNEKNKYNKILLIGDFCFRKF
ncbi:Hypothetical protein P9515_07241 [Prochlorococcus marinus str. MIT 9515]|uniref:Uncharacterized protein n=1 Tax=Prochlorococcus marinus (strain MIT 9515) TaxID=167542 RepID=A2BVX2_PROM5|nr:hypothetical protein [Prochlorococcus marinus]ABM71933.1 Hypothetical protein P9515_07241 [Prochlorococcus marinus str. MIT 9515]